MLLSEEDRTLLLLLLLAPSPMPDEDEAALRGDDDGVKAEDDE